jgi:hypothetical protein
MKIEFIKETKTSGDVIYYTNVDGLFVSNSLSLNEATARDNFNMIKEGKFNDIKEVLESAEIE